MSLKEKKNLFLYVFHYADSQRTNLDVSKGKEGTRLRKGHEKVMRSHLCRSSCNY